MGIMCINEILRTGVMAINEIRIRTGRNEDKWHTMGIIEEMIYILWVKWNK